MSISVKISQLNDGGLVSSTDQIPVARGSLNTFRIPASQFVVNGTNLGVGSGQVYLDKSAGAGSTMQFRSLSGVDGIGVSNQGSTIVISASGQNPVKTSLTGNGTTTTFAINGATSVNPNNYRVDIDGVLQEPINDYSVVGSNIVFSTAPPTSSKVTVVSNNLVRAYDIIPSDSSVTTNKIVSQAVTTDKLALSSVTTDIINNNAITTNKILNNAVTFDKVEIGNIIQAHQFGMNLRAFYAINANPNNLSVIPVPTYNQTGLVVSGSFYPKSASSRIFITCVMHFTTDSAPNVVMSLWRTPGLVVGVNPVLVSVTKVAPTGANYGQVAIIECTDTPNTTGPLTYELKVASGAGANVYVNGYNSTEFQIPGLAPQTYYRTGVTLLEVKN